MEISVASIRSCLLMKWTVSLISSKMLAWFFFYLLSPRINYAQNHVIILKSAWNIGIKIYFDLTSGNGNDFLLPFPDYAPMSWWWCQHDVLRSLENCLLNQSLDAFAKRYAKMYNQKHVNHYILSKLRYDQFLKLLWHVIPLKIMIMLFFL